MKLLRRARHRVRAGWQKAVEHLPRTLVEPDVVVAVEHPDAVYEHAVHPDRIAQVMENLVSNAMKYGAPYRPIDIEIGKTPERVRVAVTNEGAGIAPEDVPRVFGRFVRTEDARRGAVNGAGYTSIGASLPASGTPPVPADPPDPVVPLLLFTVPLLQAAPTAAQTPRKPRKA